MPGCVAKRVWHSCVCVLRLQICFFVSRSSFLLSSSSSPDTNARKIFLLQPNSKQSWRNHRRYSRRNRRICILLHRIRATSLFACLLACRGGREVGAQRKERKANQSKGKEGRKDNRMNAFFWAGRHLVEVQWLFVFCALFFWGSVNWEAAWVCGDLDSLSFFFSPFFFPPPPPFPSLFTWTGNGALMRSQWRSCKPFARTALESSESSSWWWWFPIQQEQRHVAPLVCFALPQVQDSEWQIRKRLLLFILFWRIVCNVIVEQPLPPPRRSRFHKWFLRRRKTWPNFC